jgi:hypothetical protein
MACGVFELIQLVVTAMPVVRSRIALRSPHIRCLLVRSALR